MSATSNATPDLAAGLSGEHQRVLSRIFQHPLSHNLSWRETLGLFAYIGAVEPQHDGDTVLRLGDQHVSFKAHHDKNLTAKDVMVLRHFTTRGGWAPNAQAQLLANPGTQDLMVVIDHAGARVFQLGPDADPPDGHVAPHETHHLLHEVNRDQHDADREETYPADTRYFDQIATALGDHGQIVIIGHGTGQANEADHLMTYLLNHRDQVHTRVARTIVADVSHLTLPQLAALARHALQPARDSATTAPH